MTKPIAEIDYVSIKEDNDATIVRIRPLDRTFGCLVVLVTMSLGLTAYGLIWFVPFQPHLHWIHIIGRVVRSCCFLPLVALIVLAFLRGGGPVIRITNDHIAVKPYRFGKWKSFPFIKPIEISYRIQSVPNGMAEPYSLTISTNDVFLEFGTLSYDTDAESVRDFIERELHRRGGQNA